LIEIISNRAIRRGKEEAESEAKSRREKSSNEGFKTTVCRVEATVNSKDPRSRLALKVEGLARVSKNAGGRPRLASVAFDGRYMGLAL
jgi:hypothetical protein